LIKPYGSRAWVVTQVLDILFGQIHQCLDIVLYFYSRTM
jgi:hypothetical protein